jgi:hypothetical protein
VSTVGDRLYLRAAELIVGVRSSGGRSNLVPANARTIRNRIKFTVDKTSEGNSNKANITVYNLAPDTLSFLESKDLFVILKAGYVDAISTIYVGDLLKGKNDRQGPDVITTLECGDGEVAMREAMVNVGLAAGAKNTQVIEQAIAAITAFNVSRGFVETIPSRTFANGFSYSGPAKRLLHEQLKSVGLEFSIQDGELNVFGPNKADKSVAVEISKDTGLIGYPTKTPLGVDFTSLLNPFIRPGRSCKVISKQFYGAFGSQSGVASTSVVKSGQVVRVRRALFEGDTQDGQWTVKVETVNPGVV